MEEHPRHPTFENTFRDQRAGYIDITEIGPYVIFETKFERGCVAATHPDSDGDFDGFDSAGEAICFNVAEVVKVGRDCFR